jgi:hypothetical protein
MPSHYDRHVKAKRKDSELKNRNKLKYSHASLEVTDGVGKKGKKVVVIDNQGRGSKQQNRNAGRALHTTSHKREYMGCQTVKRQSEASHSKLCCNQDRGRIAW